MLVSFLWAIFVSVTLAFLLWLVLKEYKDLQERLHAIRRDHDEVIAAVNRQSEEERADIQRVHEEAMKVVNSPRPLRNAPTVWDHLDDDD